MRTLSKICFTAVFVAAIFAASVRTAQADIILIEGVDNTGTDNVLLTSTNVAVDIVQGTVTEGGITADVFFDSDSGNLLAPSSGQARVEGATTNDPFTNLFFYLGGGQTFTNAVFNLNSATDGTMTILVTGININGGFFSEEVQVDMNGENFFTLQAINNQFMTQVELTAGAGVDFQDLRQIRLGGFDGPDVPDVTAVPEPTSMFLLGTGLFGLAAKVRGRRKK